MVRFNASASSEDVTSAFSTQIRDRTFVITGAGHPSIGSKMAISLAKFAPAHILIASRTAEKVKPVLQKIKEIDPSVKATFVQVDLTNHDSVRQAAKEILAAAPRINVLINSAGNMALKEYTVDKQGIEMQFSGNHVGHFLLTNLLVPGLLGGAGQTGNARVVNLTSSGYLISPVRFQDCNYSDGAEYDPWTGYGQAKSANILFAYGLNKKLKLRGITATAAHPGYNNDTQLGAHLTEDDYNGIFPATKKNTGKDFEFEEPRFKTYTQIAATPLIAALDPELPYQSPAYLQNSRVTEPGAEYVRDDQSVEKLWRLSEELVGQRFDYSFRR